MYQTRASVVADNPVDGRGPDRPQCRAVHHGSVDRRSRRHRGAHRGRARRQAAARDVLWIDGVLRERAGRQRRRLRRVQMSGSCGHAGDDRRTRSRPTIERSSGWRRFRTSVHRSPRISGCSTSRIRTIFPAKIRTRCMIGSVARRAFDRTRVCWTRSSRRCASWRAHPCIHGGITRRSEKLS